jgi:molybdopterin/thiamine biosynthesis adenylyltransferase
MTLSTAEFLRYQRQIALPNLGYEGQKKLKAARVLIIGLGGLGSTVALYLATTGVGKLGLVDHDKVELSNLHRQVLYTEQQTGKLKVNCAKEILTQHNPHCDIINYPLQLSYLNAEYIFRDYDIIVDCSDNFKTRYAINKNSVNLNKTLITAAINQTLGQLAQFPAGCGCCYACIYEQIDESKIQNCATAGVLGSAVGLIGTMQAQQVINYILQPNQDSFLLLIDSLNLSIKKIELSINAQCHTCKNVQDKASMPMVA